MDIHLSILASAALSFLAGAPASANDYLCKFVGDEWQWFSDHIAISTSYVAVGPPGRNYEVGTGISVNDSPWGKRKAYSGNAEFSAYGLGAVHARKADAGEPFKVCVTASAIKPITIYSSEF